MKPDLSIHLVTDAALARRAGHRLDEVVAAAVAGGVSCVQVREKTADTRRFLDTVLAVAAVLPERVALIVNDRVDVYLAALDAGAKVSGVHVGQHDLPLSAVRRLVGPGAIVGVSAATEQDLAAATRDCAAADYVGVGAVRPSSTKPGAPALGLRGLQALVELSPLPVIAIGGLSAAQLPGVRRVGAAGAAVVSAICSAVDPGAAARQLRAAWESAA